MENYGKLIRFCSRKNSKIIAKKLNFLQKALKNVCIYYFFVLK